MIKNHFEQIQQDCLRSFAEGLKQLQPAVKPEQHDRLVEVLHRLRTKMLALLREARDA